MNIEADNKELYNYLENNYNLALKNKEKIIYNGKSIQDIIKDCDNQYNGDFAQKVFKKNKDNHLTNLYINHSRRKTDSTYAWIKKAIQPINDMPFSYDISYNEVLTKKSKEKLSLYILNEINNTDLDFESEEQFLEYINYKKEQFIAKEVSLAKKNLEEITQKIKENLDHIDFENEFSIFLFYVCKYPFACLEGPVKEIDYIINDNFDYDIKNVYKVNNIHPKDIFFSSDSKDLNKSSFIFIKKNINIMELNYILEEELEKEFEIKEIKKIIEIIKENKNIKSIESDNNFKFRISFGNNYYDLKNIRYEDNIEMYHYYGKVPGYLIKDKLKKGDKLYLYYECEIKIISNYIIKIDIKYSSKDRPVYAISFRKIDNNFYGFGIPQLARNSEEAYHKFFRSLIYNARASAAPVMEVSHDRFYEFNKDNKIIHGEMALVGESQLGNNSSAIKMHQISFIGTALMPLLNYFSKQIDEDTGISKSVEGIPVGSGANRTKGGLEVLLDNSLNIIRSSIVDIDNFVLKKLAYNLYLCYSKSDKNIIFFDNIKVNIIVHGINETLQKLYDIQQNIAQQQMLQQQTINDNENKQ